jgi:alpha-mannosidase
LQLELAGIGSEEATVFGADGRQVSSQRVAGDRLLIASDNINVPALGALPIRLRRERQTNSGDSYREEAVAPGWFVRVGEQELENYGLRVRFNTDGTLRSIYDRNVRREILSDRGNQLWLFTDIPRQFDAWDIDASYVDEGVELLAIGPPEIVEEGPLRGAFRTVHRHDGIEIIQEYRLSAYSRVLEIVTRVKWHGRRRFLRAIFPLSIRSHEVWAETAFGAVSRPNHRNTPWDQARFEIPVHRWADLSEARYGVSLLNNGKYGYSAHGNVLGISLLRAPIYPDPYADEGEHEFLYAIYPHLTDWRNGTVREAEDMHSALQVMPASKPEIRPQLFKFREHPLNLACLKKAEDSDAIILRLYEAHGGRGRTIIETALPLQKAAIVNILEDETQELTVEDERRITFDFKPFQVISLKLIFKRS